MTGEKRYCIVGTGGFGKETLACLIDELVAKGQEPQGQIVFMVDDEHYNASEVLGFKVFKKSSLKLDDYKFIVAVGDPAVRQRIVASFSEDVEFATVIHPSAVLSKWVEIGAGSIVTAGVIITCEVSIGAHAHLNLHTTIGHECHIGDYFTTAPGVNVSGNCMFGDRVYLGTNCATRQGVHICDDVTIGMGAVVLKNVAEPGVFIGNPLRKLERKRSS